MNEPRTTFRQVQRLAGIGTWEWDLATDRVVWSDEIYHLMGVDRGSPLSLDGYLARVHPDDRAITRRRIEDALQRAARFVRDQRIVRADDGRVRWMRATGRVSVDERGRPAVMYGTCQDVTELKALERELVSTSRDRDLALLAAGLGHDLGSLLTTARLDADRLLAQRDDDTDAPVLDVALDRAGKLARQLVELGLGEQATPCAIDAGAALGCLSPLLGTLGPQVSLRLEAPRTSVRLRPGDLERIVLNLVRNAAEAMEGGGTVRLGLRRVNLGADVEDAGPGLYAVVSVEDDGPGMKDEVAERAFDPRISSHGEGRGLGLTVVRTLVREAGGFVRVATREGEGTRFDVFLPAV